MPKETEDRLTVAIIGAGPLGRWLAMSAARAGFRVLLEDVMPSNLHHAGEYIRRQIGPQPAGTDFAGADAGPANSTPADSGSADSGSSVAFVSTIEDAVRSADLVIDCVPDELESKLEILWLLDRMSPPRTVFATPTLDLSIADLASCTYRPEKCIAIAASPSSLADLDAWAGSAAGAALVLRTGPQTTPATIALVTDFWRRVGFETFVELAAS